MAYRINKKYNFGKGDAGFSKQSQFKETTIAKIRSQGDITRNLVFSCWQYCDIAKPLKDAIHDILKQTQKPNIDLQHLQKGIDLMEKKISNFNVPSVPEFVSFYDYPGFQIDLARCQVREFERIYKQWDNRNQIAENFLNRLSTYLFWLSWYYHYDDLNSVDFCQKANFEL